MSTKIEWTNETWNPVTGCTKISPGCKNCYAERMARRLAGRYGYPEAPHHFDVTLQPDRLDQPKRWKKPRRVFVCSMGDLFHEDADDFLYDVWKAMLAADWHTFQILTKRPDWMADYLSMCYEIFWEIKPPSHIWLGTTTEDQKRANERIPALLHAPAPVRFVSVEPMLGPVNLSESMHRHEAIDKTSPSGKQLWRCIQCGEETPAPCKWPYHQCRTLDWVIIGCESGPGRRFMAWEWAIDLVEQCKVAGVPVFVKQIEVKGKVSHDMSEWPEELRVREYPDGP